MTVYLKINSNQIIEDIITFPFEQYTEVEIETIPVDIHAGWYRWIEKNYVFDQVLYDSLNVVLDDGGGGE